jgi:hypothetical protein
MPSNLVPLRDGPALPEDVIEHVLAFGDRGFRLIAYADGTAAIDPAAALTTEDIAWLDAHRLEMRAAAHYLARVCTWPLAIVGSRFAPGIPATPAPAPAPTVPPPTTAEPRQRRLLVDDTATTPMHVEAD